MKEIENRRKRKKVPPIIIPNDGPMLNNFTSRAFSRAFDTIIAPILSSGG
jgi:hypothetical protein